MSTLVTPAGSTPGTPATVATAWAPLPAAVIAAAVALLVCSELFATSFALLWPLSEMLGGGSWLTDGFLLLALAASAAAGGWLFRRAYRVERRMSAGLEPEA